MVREANTRFHGEVAVSRVPIPTTNLGSTTHKRNYPVKLLIETGPDTSRRIKTGDRLTITTSNPENLPLPVKVTSIFIDSGGRFPTKAHDFLRDSFF